MKPALCRSRLSAGFTLVEILVAVAVLAILILMINTLFNGASTAIDLSRHHMDADSEARLVFARMGSDFAGMIKRPDVDQLFAQESSNDGMWFYSQAPAVYDSSIQTATTDPKSPVALVGYRIAAAGASDVNNGRYQLERLGQGLTWDSQGDTHASSGSTYYGMVLLTPPPQPAPANPPVLSTTAIWDPASTLGSATSAGGSFPLLIGGQPYDSFSSATKTAGYHVLGPDVFRMEICFLLKDGTYSKYPLLWNPPSSYTASSKFYNSSTSSPTYSTLSTAAAVGSRWLNTSTCETYICTSSPAGGTAMFTGTGMQDVAAIIVTIAILDNASQQIVPVAKLNNISDALLVDPTETSLEVVPPPATPIQLAAELWQNTITSGSFASTAGIPTSAAAQIRIYQRYFYLNP